MLVAYGPHGQPVVADETMSTLLQQWSHNRQLICPNCHGIVHVRGGTETRRHLHFAHQKGECAWSTESESPRHAMGKQLLAEWIQLQYPEARVSLEERLPEPNRVADIFVRHSDHHLWALEFQCAPLDIEEWQKRHTAYQAAHIHDIWIIGNNRREKQEAFIEAIVKTAHEILFLDPTRTPPRIWLRWPMARTQAISLQERLARPLVSPIFLSTRFNEWVGRTGYGITIEDTLEHISLNPNTQFIHSTRLIIERQEKLLQDLKNATRVHPTRLIAYFEQSPHYQDILTTFILPLLASYQIDPDLLLRYNYGRGQTGERIPDTDLQRIHKAQRWIKNLQQKGLTANQLQEAVQELPYTGPYAAFATYAETLLSLSTTEGIT